MGDALHPARLAWDSRMLKLPAWAAGSLSAASTVAMDSTWAPGPRAALRLAPELVAASPTTAWQRWAGEAQPLHPATPGSRTQGWLGRRAARLKAAVLTRDSGTAQIVRVLLLARVAHAQGDLAG